MSAADRALVVALDVRDPFSFLALGPTLAFSEETGAQIDWLPFPGQPLRPPSEPGPDDDRSIRHRRNRARMIAREIAIYADAQGLTLREPYRAEPAEALNRAWLWMRTHARERLEPFLAESFRRYWALDLDAADPRAVAAVVSAAGADAEACLAWVDAEGAPALDAVVAGLSDSGVYSTPAYVHHGEIFLGRQHLPMLRWRMEGATGPVPI